MREKIDLLSHLLSLRGDLTWAVSKRQSKEMGGKERERERARELSDPKGIEWSLIEGMWGLRGNQGEWKLTAFLIKLLAVSETSLR